METIDIQYQLRKKGLMPKDMAAKHNVNQVQISKVVNKLMVSDRIMRAIAEAIDKDHVEVFPEYYLNPPKRTSMFGRN